ncbi:capsular biosynthesis protein [Helicobacter sp. 11S02596-1]|uniref:capsular biosynthesis protein n=1 Tax=Helicobacter sp. 11S02596-1 TaxID=1476194 RepID=UPI000BA73617|nr:capsular biosynthesis protein [Helicobacter sp. 11S02596-1]PAF44820.1 hypothetical protein BJI48_02195 [Helicobacter sp. 11S02596-1]
MKKKVAILCDCDASKRPRPFRMIEMLKEIYEVFCISKSSNRDLPSGFSNTDGVKYFYFPPDKTSKERTQEENEAILHHCLNRDFDKLIETPNREVITEILSALPPLDLIIIEDITLLPFATRFAHASCKIRPKLLIDLREFYPLEYENDALWMETFGAFFEYLCQTYLPAVDGAMSVNTAIAQKYKEVFGIPCEVLHSLPPFYDLLPSEIDDTIGIIYHGFLSPDRDSKNLLEIATRLDERFCLYVMGMSNQAGFFESLKSQALGLKNLKFLPPVPMGDIIPFCNRFDIGIITLPNNSFNNTFALPNKFFEYIQSRLCVVAYPSPEIKAIIESSGVGKTADKFSPESIAGVLNALDQASIRAYKLASHNVAFAMSIASNKPKIIAIIESLLAQN